MLCLKCLGHSVGQSLHIKKKDMCCGSSTTGHTHILFTEICCSLPPMMTIAPKAMNCNNWWPALPILLTSHTVIHMMSLPIPLLFQVWSCPVAAFLRHEARASASVRHQPLRCEPSKIALSRFASYDLLFRAYSEPGCWSSFHRTGRCCLVQTRRPMA